MNMTKTALIGCFSLSLLLTGCGGSGGSGSSNAKTTTEKKTFTLSLTSVEVAKTADGTPVILEPDDVSSGGTVTIR